MQFCTSSCIRGILQSQASHKLNVLHNIMKWRAIINNLSCHYLQTLMPYKWVLFIKMSISSLRERGHWDFFSFANLANFWFGFFSFHLQSAVFLFWCLVLFLVFLQSSLWFLVFVNNDGGFLDFSVQCMSLFFWVCQVIPFSRAKSLDYW